MVLLCREPGQTDYVKLEHVLKFKDRLNEWIFSGNSSGADDILQYEHLSEHGSVWGMVLVKVSLSTDLLFPGSIDESGLIVYAQEESYTASGSRKSGFTKSIPIVQDLATSNASASIPELVLRMTDLRIQKSLGKKLSWTTNKRHWQQHVVLDDSSLESVAGKIATSSPIFVPSDPINFSPRHVFEALLDEYCDKDRMIDVIKTKLDSPRAFAIVSPSWLCHVGKEKAAKRPKRHVSDILLVTENGSVYLFTLVRHAYRMKAETNQDANNVNKDDIVQKTYLMTAGRLTKMLLLEDQNLLLKDRHQTGVLRVDCYLYILEDHVVDEQPLQKYTKSFFVNNVGLKHIQQTLAQNIVRQETYLKNIIGETCSYKLSVEQWYVVGQGSSAPVMVVSGPPGSGKTLLSAHCLQVNGSKTKSMYVCTTDALGSFMKSQDTCSVEIVRTELDLKALIERGGG